MRRADKLWGKLAIRQIAALPYRTEGTEVDAQVRILLVTSRGTGRWVIPKGNLPAGMAPHSAAALEAEEEAGVVGVVNPAPLGSYRYRKRRSTGASLIADVEVFALAVTHERDRWKERRERERRWFTLAEAAEAVDESDLSELIRSFRADEFTPAEEAERTGMFDWFQRLLTRRL